MTKSLPFNVGNFVLCEDIRPGLYGRVSLMGVYSGDIIVSKLGGFFHAGIYAEIYGNDLNDVDAEITVLYAGQEVVKMQTGMRFQNLREPCLFVVAPFQVMLNSEGDLTVVAVSKGVTKTLLTKRVRVGELTNVPAPLGSAAPAAPTPPL
jgi:hypothetical protein